MFITFGRNAERVKIMNDEDKNIMVTQVPRSFSEEKLSLTEFMKFMMTPAKSEELPLLTKELKASNIKRDDIEQIVDLTDLSYQTAKIGAEGFSTFVFLLREAFLSSTSSVKGFLSLLSRTEIREEFIREMEKSGIYQDVLKRGK